MPAIRQGGESTALAFESFEKRRRSEFHVRGEQQRVPSDYNQNERLKHILVGN